MNRYCIKCGKITTKQSDSLFLCENNHENWVNPPVGAVVYVIKSGKVLFGVRSIEPGKGKLSLPGGIILMHERAEQAAIRESKEELGVDITIQACLGTYATTYDDRPILNVVFIASTEDQNITPGDDMNGGEPEWRDLDDLPGPDEVAWDWYEAAQKDLLAWGQRKVQA